MLSGPVLAGAPQDLFDFFSEDHRTTEETMQGTPKVGRVSKLQRKVRASEVRVLGQFGNPETLRRQLEGIASVLDGYVHGGYPHTMELYTGRTHGMGEGFRLRGMAGTPRVHWFGRWLAMFVHPALNHVAMLLGDIRAPAEKERLIDIRRRLELSDEYLGQKAKERAAAEKKAPPEVS